MNLSPNLPEILTQDEYFKVIEQLLGHKLLMSEGRTLGYGRWRRGSGIGRFPNHGIIRFYNSTHIHVIFYDPSINQVFRSVDESISTLSRLIDQS